MSVPNMATGPREGGISQGPNNVRLGDVRNIAQVATDEIPKPSIPFIQNHYGKGRCL